MSLRKLLGLGKYIRRTYQSAFSQKDAEGGARDLTSPPEPNTDEQQLTSATPRRQSLSRMCNLFVFHPKTCLRFVGDSKYSTLPLPNSSLPLVPYSTLCLTLALVLYSTPPLVPYSTLALVPYSTLVWCRTQRCPWLVPAR